MPPGHPFEELARAAAQSPPAAAVVLGSGLGEVARGFTPLHAVTFAEVPDFPTTTVAGHRGRLSLGTWAGKSVLLLEGRLHYYEGHDWDTVALPVRTAHRLGARVLVLTNAAGGIDEALAPGSLMALQAHLDCTRAGWWRLSHVGQGSNLTGDCDRSRTRPTMRNPYTPRLLTLLREAAAGARVDLSQGVYAQVTGPCYETPAEVRALRACGADAVGMSTGREAEAAAALGMECAAISCIANRAAGLSAGPLSHDEVLDNVRGQVTRLGALIERFLGLL